MYRVLDLCTGDLAAPSARTLDLEVFMPGEDRFWEVSSVSWYRDYQARRANVRYRPSSGGQPVLVHTLNGSALAWSRSGPPWSRPGVRPTVRCACPDASPPTWAARP